MNAFKHTPRCAMQDDHAVYKIIIGFLSVESLHTV